MTSQGDYRKIGTILKPHGIRGAFVVFSECDFPDWVARRKSIFAQLDGQMVPWDITSGKLHQERLILQVAQVPDRTAMEKLRDVGLFVPEAEARAAITDADYFLNSDLIGLEMRQDDQVLGVVGDVIESPGQNLLEVKGTQNTFLVPFAQALVVDIDLDAGLIHVDLPEGLVELNEKT